MYSEIEYLRGLTKRQDNLIEAQKHLNEVVSDLLEYHRGETTQEYRRPRLSLVQGGKNPHDE